MSEEIVERNLRADLKPQDKIKRKRDLFRFSGDEEMVINLEYVYKMTQKGPRITFQSSTADFVDFEDEEAAKKAFEQILNVWAADVLG